MMPYVTEVVRERIHQRVGSTLFALVEEVKHSQDLGYIVAHLAWMYLNKMALASGYPVLEQAAQDLEDQLTRRVRSERLQEYSTIVGASLETVAGEFNYVISYLIHKSLIKTGIKYSYLNRLVGLLERVLSDMTHQLSDLQGHIDDMVILDDVYGMLRCVQLELYRVLAAPYEDEKMAENGPVSPLDAEFCTRQKRLKVLANGG